jgi:anti-sigma factor RsiW
MSALVTEADLHAYLDDQLDAARRADVQAHLAANPPVAERIGAYRRQNELLHELFDGLLAEPVAQRFLRPPATLAASRWSMWRMAAAVGWLALGAAIGLATMNWRENKSYEAAVLRPALAAYDTYAEDKNRPVEIPADQEPAIRKWLAKRMQVEVAIPKFEAQGLVLLGGRLLPGRERPNCQLMYERADGKRIAVFMTRERGTELQTMSFDKRGATELAYWSTGVFSIVIAGATSAEEMRAIAEAARAQLNPPPSS